MGRCVEMVAGVRMGPIVATPPTWQDNRMHDESICFGALAPLAAALLACSGSTGSAAPVTCHDWPTAATVGIPADTPALTPMAEESYHTDHDGQVFDHVELLGRLYVDHKNVIVRRSRLVGDVYYAIYSADDATGLIVEDSDIQGGVLFSDGFIGRRNHLHARPGGDKDDGWIFAASHVLLEDNLIDGLVGGPGAHLDGIQAMAGQDITIRNNWIEAISPPIPDDDQGRPGGVNAAVFFKPDFGEISDVTVDCNMLIEEEGYYPLRIDARGAVVVRHNRWRRGFVGTSPVDIRDGTTVTTWEDNAYEDGEVIPAP
jgi:hypothetical protein